MEFEINTDTWFVFTLLFISALGLYIAGYIAISYSARAKPRSRRRPRELRKREAHERLEKKYSEQKISHLEQDNEKLQLDLKKDLQAILQSDAPDLLPFISNFEKVYPNFGKSLLNEHPEITAGDVKLCAFIRLNLSSKEIAQLLNITPESVNKARYRLRKKLNLTAQEDLFVVLSNLG